VATKADTASPTFTGTITAPKYIDEIKKIINV